MACPTTTRLANLLSMTSRVLGYRHIRPSLLKGFELRSACFWSKYPYSVSPSLQFLELTIPSRFLFNRSYCTIGIKLPDYLLQNVFILFNFETGVHCVLLKAWDLLCWAGWPWTHRELPAPVYWVLRLKDHYAWPCWLFVSHIAYPNYSSPTPFCFSPSSFSSRFTPFLFH